MSYAARWTHSYVTERRLYITVVCTVRLCSLRVLHLSLFEVVCVSVLLSCYIRSVQSRKTPETFLSFLTATPLRGRERKRKERREKLV